MYTILDRVAGYDDAFDDEAPLHASERGPCSAIERGQHTVLPPKVDARERMLKDARGANRMDRLLVAAAYVTAVTPDHYYRDGFPNYGEALVDLEDAGVTTWDAVRDTAHHADLEAEDIQLTQALFSVR